MYEHHTDPLLPRRQFVLRLLGHALVAGLALLVSLAIGILGYHSLVGLSWLDSILNAAMILGGVTLRLLKKTASWDTLDPTAYVMSQRLRPSPKGVLTWAVQILHVDLLYTASNLKFVKCRIWQITRPS